MHMHTYVRIRIAYDGVGVMIVVVDHVSVTLIVSVIENVIVRHDDNDTMMTSHDIDHDHDHDYHHDDAMMTMMTRMSTTWNGSRCDHDHVNESEYANDCVSDDDANDRANDGDAMMNAIVIVMMNVLLVLLLWLWPW